MIEYAAVVYARGGDNVALSKGLVFVVVILVLNLCASILIAHAQHLSWQVGVLSRASSISLIYKKALTISARAKLHHRFDDGAIMIFANRDAERFYATSFGVHECCGKALSLFLSCAFLLANLGYSALAGMAIMLLIKPVQVPLVSRTAYRFRKAAVEFTTERSVLMLAVLRGIRFIKLFAWEKSFARDLARLRWKETWKIRGLHFTNTANYGFEQCQMALMILTSESRQLLSRP